VNIGRKPAALWALLAAPFVTAGLLGLLPGCPVLATTGVPCPTCGGTRGLFLLFQGDPHFVDYNPFWAVAVVLALIAAAIGSVRLLRGRPFAGPPLSSALAWMNVRTWPITLTTSAAILAGWVTAMVNVETIRVPGT